MFTGIISHQGQILHSHQGVYTIQSPFNTLPTIGQSIAHDGACMSVTEVDKKKNTYQFFAMQESLNKTNYTHKQLGEYFNIELCMVAGDRLDGHFVTGHVDTTGTITDKKTQHDGSLKLHIGFDSKWSPLILPKGSIAINGISLTVVDEAPGSCSIRLIPLTQSDTNLGLLQVGDHVNLEFDMLGKYVLKSQGVALPVH